jgi:hypothetical protein
MPKADKVRKQVLEFTEGRWASMYDMVERIAPRDLILEAIRTITNEEQHQVRKRDPDGTEDLMLREYRTYTLACKGCANRLGEFHKASCQHAGHLVRLDQTKEW